MSVELLQGDCLELMRNLPDASIDAIIADLPYGTTACSWDAVIPFEPLWAQYKRVIKPAGVVVLFGSQPFTTLLIQSNFEWFKYSLTWAKERGTGFTFAKYQPLRITEDICVFCSGTGTYNPQTTKLDKPYKHALPIYKSDSASLASSSRDEQGNRIYKTYDTSQPTTLLPFPRDKEKIHPTQKPLALLEWLVRTYTNAGEIVLDNTMGSGTTGAGVQTSYVYGTDAALVKDSTGNYHLDWSCTVKGVHKYRWVIAGTIQAAEEGVFTVRPQSF